MFGFGKKKRRLKLKLNPNGLLKDVVKRKKDRMVMMGELFPGSNLESKKEKKKK